MPSENHQKPVNRFAEPIQNFWQLFNSYVNDVQRMKDSGVALENEKSIAEQAYVLPSRALDLKKIHISVMKSNKNLQLKKQYIKIDWNAKSKEECAKPNECRKDYSKIISIKNEWVQRKFENFYKLLQVVKPKIDCEKKFYEIRFLMKCIELNSWKSTLYEEKLCIKILQELEQLLTAEKNDLSIIEEEMFSLKSLRQHEKSNWINLYHELIKMIGRNHKHKGYFKQIFKKKLVQKEDRKSHLRTLEGFEKCGVLFVETVQRQKEWFIDLFKLQQRRTRLLSETSSSKG
ncbi:uncharacterized protein TNCV_2587871 [Trichonephila clavipes]|nr:uncharacterized protein TNCV_2587871 [Trichonephila clavipes]